MTSGGGDYKTPGQIAARQRRLKTCVQCGVKSGVSVQRVRDDFSLPMCNGCASSLEWFCGMPIMLEKPKKCPICGSKDIEPDLDAASNLDAEEWDAETARAFGIESEELERLELDDEDIIGSPFIYTLAYMECFACGEVVAHGPRGYWNETDGDYTSPKPETPAERAERERVAAGQLEMFGERNGA